MKLLIAGLTLIALGLGLVVFTDLNPALLFIGGVACAFIGIVHGSTRPDHGPAVSAGSVSDAESLANLQNYGSAAGDAHSIFDGNP